MRGKSCEFRVLSFEFRVMRLITIHKNWVCKNCVVKKHMLRIYGLMTIVSSQNCGLKTQNCLLFVICIFPVLCVVGLMLRMMQ